ncbi:hypothetical protein BDW71DRAFT_199552 [Aspergillus fruticulosus]
MKVCPHKALSVLSSLSTSILPYNAGPATASISVCCAAVQSTSLSPSLYDSSSPTYHASQATYWRLTSRLNRTTYNEEKRIASIEPGARWKRVYGALAEYGVGVAGGRGGTVSGGYPHHSALFGFACDAVVKFEIVLPNSTLTTANSTHNPHLFKALKGGPGSFGIVTCFDMETFPQPRNSICGGIVTYEHDETTVNAQINALPFAGPYPDASAPFYLLPNISDTTRQTDLEGLVGELEPESGLHSNFFTVTFANGVAILKKAVEIQERLIGEVQKIAKSSEWNIKSLYQPLPGLFAEIGRRRGGVNIYELDDFARSVPGNYPYVYLSCAAESQNPLRSYGDGKLEFLKALAKESDP